MGGQRGRKLERDTRAEAVTLIEEAQKNGARIAKCCEELCIGKRTFERWRKYPEGDRRRGPKTKPPNKLTDTEKQQILNVACSAEFRDKNPHQIIPILADRGIYIGSESSFYRVLRAQKMLSHRERSRPPTHTKPKELIAHAPNQVWSWDITYLRSSILGKFFYLYMVIDIYSRKIVAWELADHESSEVASHMISHACKKERITPQQLFIHSDNGGPMKGAMMLATLKRLGVLPSFSRPHVSDDNAFSEALFRTLKYRPWYPNQPFDSLAEASKWVKEFVRWYNTEHLHSSIQYVTPECRHQGRDILILELRKRVYELARKKNPTRWKAKIRKWETIPFVPLNPLRKKDEPSIQKSA